MVKILVKEPESATIQDLSVEETAEILKSIFGSQGRFEIVIKPMKEEASSDQ